MRKIIRVDRGVDLVVANINLKVVGRTWKKKAPCILFRLNENLHLGSLRNQPRLHWAAPLGEEAAFCAAAQSSIKQTTDFKSNLSHQSHSTSACCRVWNRHYLGVWYGEQEITSSLVWVWQGVSPPLSPLLYLLPIKINNQPEYILDAVFYDSQLNISGKRCWLLIQYVTHFNTAN